MLMIIVRITFRPFRLLTRLEIKMCKRRSLTRFLIHQKKIINRTVGVVCFDVKFTRVASHLFQLTQQNVSSIKA